MKNPKTALTNFNQERLENKAIIAKMSPENRKYDQEFFTGLLEAKKVGKDDSGWEEILDNFRSDLLKSQENQVPASQYFGMSASELARQTVEQMPEQERSTSQKVRRFMLYPLFLLLALSLITLTPWFGGGLTKRNIGFVLFLLLMNIVAWLVGLFFPGWALKIWPEKTAKERAKIEQVLSNSIFFVFIVIAVLIRYLL